MSTNLKRAVPFFGISKAETREEKAASGVGLLDIHVFYFTVTLTADSHFCPVVLRARRAMRCVPAGRLMGSSTVVDSNVLEYHLPSSQTCR
jgi:hypothetical protein